MTKHHGRSGARGFTLIELMVGCAIVGLLASVALPEYGRSALRARSAERRTIMVALQQAITDVITNTQGLPGGVAAWSGAWNPAGVPTPARRRFDWTMASWNSLPMIVVGDSFYSYRFTALDPARNGENVTLTVGAEGDLDGDGALSVKEMYYVGVGYAFQPDQNAHGWDGLTIGPEDPPYGMEDLTTY